MQKTFLLLIFVMFLPFSAMAQRTLATSKYVERQMESAVTVTGDQEINGVKEYKASPVVPTPDLPTAEAL